MQLFELALDFVRFQHKQSHCLGDIPEESTRVALSENGSRQFEDSLVWIATPKKSGSESHPKNQGAQKRS